ncbi:hypothetical protein MNEG_16628 [Monoraphidium neglectum]|uniref:Protein kinase domain-containing protein n=1 Tax=Monoraphidium neglectum TaxID=145388 RepID=A0A0D2LMR1_9CHLO|nr:hypothetical protein MNEG_16628 [Monoraphidium neglectum]KIY91336.1 hypothetical protein MNEG_16628 [Monoraphidium neglectum]|eukprot:XP_013890356.1 hypothetical protein MNEG_16628 [Monoraphidium neglectum]
MQPPLPAPAAPGRPHKRKGDEFAAAAADGSSGVLTGPGSAPSAAAASSAPPRASARASARRDAGCGSSGAPPRAEAQTWLILEFCDGGNLADAVRGGLLLRCHEDDDSEDEQADGEGREEGEGAGSLGDGGRGGGGGDAAEEEEGGEAPIDLPRALQLLLDVARGMAYLHERNVVHADLKCQNVLLASSPEAPWGCVAKISDFAALLNPRHPRTHAPIHPPTHPPIHPSTH